VLSVNWFERFGSQRHVPRMLRRIDSRIAVVTGSDQLVEDFDGVHSLPAAYLFDGNGNEIFRVGGDFGANGRHFMNAAQIKRAVEQAEKAFRSTPKP